MQAAIPAFFWILAVMTGVCAVATVVSQNIVRSATWLLFTLAGTSAIFFLLNADLVGAIQLLVYVGGTMVLVVFGVMLTAQGPFINMKSSSAEWAISATVGMLLLGVLAITVLGARPLTAELAREKWGLKKAQHAFAVQAQREKVAFLRSDLEDSLVKAKAFVEGAKVKRLKAEFQKTGWTEELKGKRQALIAAIRQRDRLEAVTPVPPLFEYSPKKLSQDDPGGSHHSATIGQGFLGVGVGPAHNENGKPVRMSYLLPFELVSVHLLVVLIGAAYLARAKRHRRQPAVVATRGEGAA